MGQVIQVNGDYNIKAGAGKTITLDTGLNEGQVRVTGNLVVDGDTLTVNAEDLNVQDNIITLNFGEPGPGVTKGSAGILVDRGYSGGAGMPQPGLIFIEEDQTWNIVFTDGDGYSFSNSTLKVQKILNDPDVGPLILLDNNATVVSVGTSLNYEDRVIDDNDIPNKAYVDRAIEISPTYQIRRDDTRVIALDIDDPIDSEFLPEAIPSLTESQVAIIADTTLSAVFYSDRSIIQGMTIFKDPVGVGIPDTVVLQQIDPSGPGSIRLDTSGGGNVEFTWATKFNHIGGLPTSDPVVDSTVVYGDSVGPGDTGIYFINANKADEIISKNKALLFSMLF